MSQFLGSRTSAACFLAFGLVIGMLGSGWNVIAQEGSKRAKAAPRRARTKAAETKKSAADVGRLLDGAWRLVKALDPNTGKLRAIPSNIEMTKLIVGGRFAWVLTQDGQAVAGAGGTCTLAQSAYSETVTYAVSPSQKPLVGTTFRFTWKLEGGQWHHKGTLQVGQARQEIDEIWERIP